MRIEVILDEGTDDASATNNGTLGSSPASAPPPPARFREIGGPVMEDLLWILVMVALVAATLAYARLCDNA